MSERFPKLRDVAHQIEQALDFPVGRLHIDVVEVGDGQLMLSFEGRPPLTVAEEDAVHAWLANSFQQAGIRPPRKLPLA